MRLDAETYLLEIPLWTREKNTLAQVRDILTAMGSPDQQMSFIHVAGSNGKGSVCADLTRMLMQGGYRVGTFVSPHLVELRERCLLDGQMVDKQQFQSAFEQVYKIVQEKMAEGYCHPTFFEFMFLVTIQVFSEWKPDYVILETGLGGRLDTTNVIQQPLACVLTSISLEHTQYLGDTIAQIAAEKAGIIKWQVPVIYDDNQPEASAVIRSQAAQMMAPAYPVGAADGYRKISFEAPYQERNAALAYKTIQVLEIPGMDDAVCQAGLLQVSWPGRMESLGDNIWLDGAHNSDGIKAFIEAVRKKQEKDPADIQILFAAVADKDYNEMIRMLCQELNPRRVSVARLKSERGSDSDALAALFLQSGCQQAFGYADTAQALEAALAHKTDTDRLYIVGSLYLAGEIKEQIRRRQDDGF